MKVLKISPLYASCQPFDRDSENKQNRYKGKRNQLQLLPTAHFIYSKHIPLMHGSQIRSHTWNALENIF